MDLRTASIGLSIACSLHEEPLLVLDGPDHVHVHELGPVEGPHLRLSDGTIPSGIRVVVPRRDVAEVGEDRVIARGPGRTPVVARWRNQEVVWTLQVDLETELLVSNIPSQLHPGDKAHLDLAAVRSGEPVALGEVVWASSDPTVLEVREGQVEALRPGRAFVTAQTSSAQAMVELAVVNDRH